MILFLSFSTNLPDREIGLGCFLFPGVDYIERTKIGIRGGGDSEKYLLTSKEVKQF